MERFCQSPTDPEFVQDPYRAYARARAMGDLVWWDEMDMVAAVSHRAVTALFRHPDFGREVPPDLAEPVPAALAPFYDIEAHSLLEAEPPRHTRLRGLVLRAFTSRQIAAMVPAIDALTEALLAAFPARGEIDLLDAFARPLPVRVIARLMGVPEAKATDLLAWSNAMVGMYQAGRTAETEAAAVAAARAFRSWLEDLFEARRTVQGDDLLSRLLAAEAAGDRLNRDELVATVVLLLNAGHEATVHTLGNGLHTLIAQDLGPVTQAPDRLDGLVEEVLRHDPPLHIFTRWCMTPTDLFGHRFSRGDQVALVIGSANRDPTAFEDPDRFNPDRPIRPHLSFGGGIHFCVGAPLARLELKRALPALFATHPKMTLASPPRYAPIYHFHGLERLAVTLD